MVIRKVLSSLLLVVYLLSAGLTPVQAALIEGKFIPGTAKKVTVSSLSSRSHQVRPGDTLWDISRSYDVDLYTVMAMNGLYPASILTIGATIRLPTNNARCHLVEKGETMWSIAALYNMEVAELHKLNGDKDPQKLKIGEQLIIPAGTVRAALVMAEPSRSLEKNLYAWPLQGEITSYYGWRKSGFHHGLDIAAAIGTPVKAADDGRICFVGTKEVYGQTVIIEHADMKQTLYAHLNSFNVKKGQKVLRGQVIGYVGVTGRTTGPHLHFGVMKDGETFDPLQYLRR